jgi:hypothetical protein
MRFKTLLGENKQYKGICSSLLRKNSVKNSNSYNELVNNYYREIATNIGDFERDNFLAFSQHHGLLTNLIDFTTTPLVSLYFACENSKKTKNSNGFVYLINKKNTIDISELLNKYCTPPSFSHNLIDLFTFGDKRVINFFRQSLSSYFWEHSINPYLRDMFSCSEELCYTSDMCSSKDFINDVHLLSNEDIYIDTYKKYFRNLDMKYISKYLCQYLILLKLYLSDVSSASFFNVNNNKIRFPKMPYLIYKTPYKFDRIRNQEGIFIYT